MWEYHTNSYASISLYCVSWFCVFSSEKRLRKVKNSLSKSGVCESSVRRPYSQKRYLFAQCIDSIFASMERNGKDLLSAGVLKQSDVEGAVKGNKATGKIMVEGLPAYCNVNGLIRSAKSSTSGILLCKPVFT